MYRVLKPVDQGWELWKELKKLPKDFKLPEGYQLERDNENGSTTIVESPDLEISDEEEAVA